MSSISKPLRRALCALWLVVPQAQATTQFTHLGPESPRDQRVGYEQDLLRLALEETRADFGDYRLDMAPPMNRARLLLQLEQNRYPNLFASHSWFKPEQTSQLAYVRFPIMLGMLSYRVCFVNEAHQADVSRVTRLAELQRFSQVQGRGWQDVRVLRQAGMQVQEVDDYERLFKLVARGRAALFCRGAGEVYQEWQQHQDMAGLMLDKELTIYYPNLHLFYTNKANQAALTRVQTGLERAWQQGSLQRLWRQHFQPALDLVRLDRRRQLPLANPEMDDIDFDYRPYLYHPASDDLGLGTAASPTPGTP